MGQAEKKERFDKLTGAQLLWASTIGASFDLGIMNRAMLIPSMKTAAQRLVLHQMQKGSFPFLEDNELDIDFFKKTFENLNQCIHFANRYEIELKDDTVILKINRDSCMYCPTGVGGAQLGFAICPYPQLFSVYIDSVIKNAYKFKTVDMVKSEDGLYMYKEDEWDIVPFKIRDDDEFKEMVDILNEGAKEIESVLEDSLKNGVISNEDLWDRNYIEVPDTNPQKYKTKFTDFVKEYVQPIEDKYLAKNKKFRFFLLVDDNGYAAAHNSMYDKDLTGDYKKDLLGNRSMRIFNDFTGLQCARHERDFLLQPYPRDVGVLMYDLSKPIYVEGKHWGGLRVGIKY